ncbi:protein kinase, partial [Salmonella sp. s51228]|uniref:protein kinase n=1 Tax=Salmonella sp. s51228 TaxID=3159652 RepID=UPI00397E9C96
MQLQLSSNNNTTPVTVALKKLMYGATREIKDAFSKEIKFMTRLDHPNVIKLVGVCLEETDEHHGRFILMEYMLHGDLAQYLQTAQYKDTAG